MPWNKEVHPLRGSSSAQVHGVQADPARREPARDGAEFLRHLSYCYYSIYSSVLNNNYSQNPSKILKIPWYVAI